MRYIYYTLYRHFSNVKSNDTPAFNAMVFISILQSANIQTILLFVPAEFKISYHTRDQVALSGILLGLLLFAVNYFVLIKPLPELKNKYKNESAKSKMFGTVLLLSYIIVTALSTYFISVNIIGD
ncbi:hypothetical protein GCM10027049_30510 [Mucilaginibacter puniceus]